MKTYVIAMSNGKVSSCRATKHVFNGSNLYLFRRNKEVAVYTHPIGFRIEETRPCK